MDPTKALTLLLLALNLVTSNHSPPLPPFREVCKRNPSHIRTARRSGDNGYQVFLEGDVEEYRPGKIYKVGIRAGDDEQMFNGFMLTAVASNLTMEPMGTFMLAASSDARPIRSCPHILSHVDFRLKRQVLVQWKAPLEGNVCVEFRATVLERSNSWYKDEGKLTKIFCPEDIPEHAMEEEDECCACGSAKYEMMFEGIWSDKSHPINYPTQKRLLHWSNIVGASHNSKYHIWKYGGHATRGVKEVCELGYPRTLEGEVLKQSRDVRTLIKTTGIWWRDPEGIVQNRTARFSTDSLRRYVSVITMLGPSPDWCVGISSVNVCQKDCTWSDGFVVDLLPWDAGTDDGISYMSPNARSDPQKRIRKITNRWPNDPQSPFYGPHPIKPVARLHVKKIGETKPPTPEQCNDETLTDFIGEGSDSNEQHAISAKCMVSEWDDWSRCSVTCGVGTRSRRRMYKTPGVEGECDVALMEKENCIGIENECESIDEDCGMTQWSDWSPCSVTCGQGHREKIRYYFEAEDMENCNRSTKFREVCYGKVEDCKMSKKDSAVCQLPMVKGPCRGSFEAWYFDVAMQKCLPFEYGGCRGNENRFESMDECVEVCSTKAPEKEAKIDLAFCMAPSDRGSCGKHEEMWFFDKTMQKCLSFDYSGCGGNNNRFKTMDECSDACQLVGIEGVGSGGDDMLVKCQQPPLEGPCSQNLERWYFDTQMQKCLPFQFGGCGSNDNNFETMDQCTEVCTLNPQLQDALLKKALNTDFLHFSNQGGGSRYKRFCTLPPQKGPCRASLTRWYFDLSTLKCLSFEYGGCVGNANNFESIQMCEEGCLGKVSNNSTATKQLTTKKPQETTASSTKLEQQNDEMYKMVEKMKMKKKADRNINCKVSQWSEWSACSASCGRGHRTKTRQVLKERMGRGKKCPKMMTRKQPCRRLPSCQTKCQYGPWSSWSACSRSCGMASFKQRTKSLPPHQPLHRFAPSPPPPTHPSLISTCPDKRQRVLCRLPKCLK